MKLRSEKGAYLLRLEKGDEIIASLKKVAEENISTGGFIFGMGAVNKATIGIYNPEKGEYFQKTFEGDLEVGNLIGNISYLEDSDEPVIHCHVTLADHSLSAYTGHLFEAYVSVTLEVYIRVFNKKLRRAPEPGTDFKFWQL